MPDMTPVGNTIIPPNPMAGINAYSGMLGIQQQKQALQTGQYAQESAQAAATVAQQGAKELQAGSRLLADPVGNGLIDDEGNPTKNAYSIIKNVMPTTGDERYQSLIKTAQGHVEFRNAVQNLSQNEQGYVSSRLAGIVADPNAHISDVSNGINDLKAQFKGTAEEKSVNRMVSVMQDAIDDAGDKHGMDGVRQVVNGFSRGAIGNTGLTGPGGVTAPSMTTVQGPKGIQPVNLNPNAPQGIGPVGPPIAQGVSPGVMILTDANKNQYRYNTQTGQIEGKIGSPPADKTRGQGGFVQPIAGQEEAQAAIESTRRADADYGVNRHVNDQILRLSKDTSTGPGTDIWHHALGALAGPLGADNVADYQTIGAYLDRQAALSAKQMGLPDTNAGLATAASLSGTTGYQPKALQTKVNLTDALVEGAHQFRQGLDRVVGTGPNQDLSRYQAFRGAWAANFDPNVYRLENAVRRHDTGEIQDLKKELGPQGLQQLRVKRQNLMSLAQGQIPSG